MNARRLSLCVATLALLIGASGTAAANGSWGKPKVIDCDKGMNPQHFLDQRLFSRPIELYLVGTCPAFTIMRDDVIVAAHPKEGCPGATVNGGIVVSASDRVELRCLTVTGTTDEAAVRIIGGTAYLEDNHITGNLVTGLSITSGAYVEVQSNHIDFNAGGILLERASASIDDTRVSGNDGLGIEVEHNSSLEFLGGSVEWNGGAGMIVTNDSTLAAEGVQINWNGSSGIAVTYGSNASIDGCVIGNNARIIPTRSGVFASTNSSVAIGDTEIYGNWVGVGAQRHSFVNLSGNTHLRDNLTHGLRLRYDAGAVAFAGVQIPANDSGTAVFCFDTESSFDDRGGGIDPGLVECDGFDLPEHDHPHDH